MRSRVLYVLAHPDDESMGNGATIARHTGAGVDVHLVCATRGRAGWVGLPPQARLSELPAIRTRELERAAAALGLASVVLWDYPDAEVAAADQAELSRCIGREIERLAPDVVVGWGPDGGYGHPDHIAVGACTDAAVARVAPHLPAYHMAASRRQAEDYRRALDLVGGNGSALPVRWHDEVTLVFEPTPDELEVKREAIACHSSQLQPPLARLLRCPEAMRLYGPEGYLRVGSEGARPTTPVSGVFPELRA